MKSALLAGLAALSMLAPAPTRGADELRVIYPAGSQIAFEEREWKTTEAREASMRINGKDAPEDMVENLKSSMAAERQDKLVRFTTWLDAVEDGRPVGARRRFDELACTTKKGDEESEEEGRLVGRTVLLSADAAGDEVVARLAEDDAGPELDLVFLANHRLALELELYLPERAVEVGDTWELPEAAVREILSIDDHEPNYFESDTAGEDNALTAVLREEIKVSGSIEYERREDLEGVACAVLLISLRGEVTDAEVDPELLGIEEEQGMENSAKVTTWMEGEERLWFALEAGRPVRSTAEWKGEIKVDIAMSNPGARMEVAIGTVADMRGGFEQSWSFEDEE